MISKAIYSGVYKIILAETDNMIREKMLNYMAELFEDASDLWTSAKAARAMLLCEMERGMVT